MKFPSIVRALQHLESCIFPAAFAWAPDQRTAATEALKEARDELAAMPEPSTRLDYWPCCTVCRSPFDFDPDEPFAYCKCGTTEWGNPRPAPHLSMSPAVAPHGPVTAEVATVGNVSVRTEYGPPGAMALDALLDELCGGWRAGEDAPYMSQRLAAIRRLASRVAPFNSAHFIALTPAEIQSGSDRVKWAEGLIRQLPVDHDGRNSWLLNYGACVAPALSEVTPHHSA